MTAVAVRRVLPALIALVLPAGCTDGPTPRPVATGSEQAAADVQAAQAGDLRVDIEQALAVHSYLMLESARVPADARPATLAAARRFADPLVAAVRAISDGRAAREFRGVWTQYAEALADYAANDGRRRQPVVAAARDLAKQMASVTHGGMEVEGTTALLVEPTRELLAAADADAAGDHERAYGKQRLGFADMVSVGRAFSAAVAEQSPDRYPGARTSGPLELRSALRQLFVEHTLLVATVMRRGSRGTDDFPAAAAALNGNTDDVVAALETVYPDVRGDVAAAWRSRISALADYTVAAVEAPARRREHRDAVAEAEEDIASLLGDASEGNVAEDTLSGGLRRCSRALQDQLDAFVGDDFGASQESLLKSLRCAATVADAVAAGIVSHRPQDFPPS